MNKTYKASCLCGQVTFSVAGFSPQAANCHCTMCRKFHGAAFGTLVVVHNLQWLTGEVLLQDYCASNGTTRTFCKECGSSLGFRVKEQSRDAMEVAIATFDEVIPVKVDAHIYTDYKACWHEITDNLDQHKEGRQS
jgi:hypothetical protein